ncbi:hypothetical protein MIH18_02745 [Marinobacter sp. M3C]|jgi:hypothetical protein|uniref:hypothetical protein n=1 Tax=Marinobacter sp. M3C TaxID=2917715 RepID=UPI00200C0C6E|nr:hypothetical protein [Marinobacter sp. M3C]UQG60889.1 hypothetical protein MIH18_02745 [Marinobacter sp. M3C]
MIAVTVAGVEQSLEGLSDSWLHEQIKRRQRAGDLVCVEQTSDTNVGVSSGACPPVQASSRRPNEKEREVLDLWKHFSLGEEGLNSGKLVAFLQRLRTLI